MPVALVAPSTTDWLNTPPRKRKLTQSALESPAVIEPPRSALPALLVLLADVASRALGGGALPAVAAVAGVVSGKADAVAASCRAAAELALALADESPAVIEPASPAATEPPGSAPLALPGVLPA